MTAEHALIVASLKGCVQKKDLAKGINLHAAIAKGSLLHRNPYVANTLISMYAKCGALAQAQQVLDDIPVRDVVAWSALIASLAKDGQAKEAMKCFDQMQYEGLFPNAITYSCILKACGSAGAVEKGKQVHDAIFARGFLGKDIVLGTALVDMYAKCGLLSRAELVLDQLPVRNAACWNALIAGYAQQGQGEEALRIYEKMQGEGHYSDCFTFSSVLKACGSIGAAAKGKQIHYDLALSGLVVKNIVVGNALVDMYSRCGVLAKAIEVLDRLPVRNIISWSSIIAGYSKQGQIEKALSCFEQMLQEGLSPDAVSFTCMLKACSRSGLYQECQKHMTMMSTNYGVTPVVQHYTCLVDVFGHMGQFDIATSVIKKMPFCGDQVIWSALLATCKKWGNRKLGKWVFERATQSNDSAVYAFQDSLQPGMFQVYSLQNCISRQ